MSPLFIWQNRVTMSHIKQTRGGGTLRESKYYQPQNGCSFPG